MISEQPIRPRSQDPDILYIVYDDDDNNNNKIIPVIIGAAGTISKSFR